ncbi:hypothetical protein M0R45_007352 [Rubus argutus]|uniref:DUF4283 domain-containing protein n=1 Tax=Rubus argutus TaxID=59490 RepID=A0AAW1XY04_RUBAR
MAACDSQNLQFPSSPLNPESPTSPTSNTPKKSFAAALYSDSPLRFAIGDLPTPFVEDGIVSVKISEEPYQRGLSKRKLMLIGRVSLSTKNALVKSHDLLRSLWPSLQPWTIAPLGKGFFVLQFQTLEDMQRIWAIGSVSLQQGMLRLIKWTPGFSPSSYKNTFAQVWVRFWDLGFAFWEDQTLFEIANGVGTPLKIDPRTKNREVGLYARLLIDVDFSKPTLSQLSVTRANGEKVLIGIEYENVPIICDSCGIIGHQKSSCKLNAIVEVPTVVTTADPVRGRSTTKSSQRRRVRSQHHDHQRKPNLASVEPIQSNAEPVAHAPPQLDTEPVGLTFPALGTLLPDPLVQRTTPCPLIEVNANQVQASSAESAPPSFPQLRWEVSNTTSTASYPALGFYKVSNP